MRKVVIYLMLFMKVLSAHPTMAFNNQSEGFKREKYDAIKNKNGMYQCYRIGYWDGVFHTKYYWAYHVDQLENSTFVVPINFENERIVVTCCVVYRNDQVLEKIDQVLIDQESNGLARVSVQGLEKEDIIEISYSLFPKQTYKDRLVSFAIQPIQINKLTRDCFAIVANETEDSSRELSIYGEFSLGVLDLFLPRSIRISEISTDKSSSIFLGEKFKIKGFESHCSKLNSIVAINPGVEWEDIIQKILTCQQEHWTENVEGLEEFQLQTKEERVLKAIQWIQKNISLVEGESFLFPKSPANTLKGKKGNALDCAYLFQAILAYNHVDSMVCLVPKKNKTFAQPSLTFVDHAVICVQLDDGECWIDPMKAEIKETLRLSQCQDYKEALPLERSFQKPVPVTIDDGTSWLGWVVGFFK